jgi:hypothetical protein
MSEIESSQNTHSNTLVKQFQKFFNVSGFFNADQRQVREDMSNAQIQQQKERDNRIEELREQADYFLQAQALSSFAKMMSKGYEPTSAQEDKFNTLFEQSVDEKRYDKIADMIESGMQLKPNHYVYLIFNNKTRTLCLPFSTLDSLLKPEEDNQPGLDSPRFHISDKDRQIFYVIGKALQACSEDDVYNRRLFKQFMTHINSINTLFSESTSKKTQTVNMLQSDLIEFCKLSGKFEVNQSLLNAFDYMAQPLSLKEYSELLEKMNLIKDYRVNTSNLDYNGKESNNFKNLAMGNESWSRLANAFHHRLSTRFEQHFSRDIDRIMDETQNLYMDKFLAQKASEESVKNSQKYSLEMLPSDTRKVVETIRQQYDGLSAQMTRLDQNDLHDLKGLVQEKLPKYINDFLSMKEEYRTTMVNAQGKNAHDLLNESLANIAENLKQIEVRLNEDNLKELSVGAKYTKAKMNM